MNYIGNMSAGSQSAYIGKQPASAIPTPPSALGALVGVIVWRHSVAAGTLRANGQAVAKAAYPELWAYAQGQLTADQAANPGLYRDIDAANFAVPKLDGLFIRGQGQVDANHVSAALGVKQADEIYSHVHDTGADYVGGTSAVTGGNTMIYLRGQGTPFNTGARGGTESRPVNVALIPCILIGR